MLTLHWFKQNLSSPVSCSVGPLWVVGSWYGDDTTDRYLTVIRRETRSDLISMSSPTTILYLIVSVMIFIPRPNDAIICPDQSGSSFNDSDSYGAHCPLGEYSEASSTPIYHHPWTWPVLNLSSSQALSIFSTNWCPLTKHKAFERKTKLIRDTWDWDPSSSIAVCDWKDMSVLGEERLDMPGGGPNTWNCQVVFSQVIIQHETFS